MKFKFKTLFAVSFSILFVFLTGSITYATVNLPSSVRIGLYFKGALSDGHPQTSCFNISAVKGVQLGYVANSKYNVLYTHSYSSKVTIRKDGYFVVNDSKFVEYSPSGNIPSGTKYGPYHIQIGNSYSSYTNAKARVPILKEAGVTAFPVYNDGWYVWTGNYVSQDSALTDMISNISKKVSPLVAKIINADQTRIVIDLGTSTLFMFDSASGAFQVHPKSENSPSIFLLNTQHYRGNLEVKRLTASDMTLINVVPLQKYLYGVVPSEMPALSHAEALKAQSVVARTYTYNSLKKHSSLGFDLCSTIDCQEYLGYDNEHPATNQAVDGTVGKTVTYNGNSALVFYFASSGGKTEDVKNVWGSSYPYLISVKDSYESSDFAWTEERSPSYIKDKMAAWGYSLGDVTGVAVTKRSTAGRATELVITCKNGTKTFTLERTRSILGLKSQWFYITSPQTTYFRASDGKVAARSFSGMTVVSSNGTQKLSTANSTLTLIDGTNTKKTISTSSGVYIFKGKGSGHAIGMSQQGAMGMGKAGFTYSQILTHYFPGTVIQ